MLINTIEIEPARHEVEKSQLELRVERLRAEELDDQAHTDPLTRLPNRRALERELPWLIGRAQKRMQPLCAAMIDFDHFKRVNDEYGHATGDRVLTVMAAMLRTITRGSDLAVRVGGEEFLLVFAETGLNEALHACEWLLTSVRTYDWDALAPGLPCTVSAGLARLEGDENVADWLARADAALYEAKHAGRDQIATASSGLRRGPLTGSRTVHAISRRPSHGAGQTRRPQSARNHSGRTSTSMVADRSASTARTRVAASSEGTPIDSTLRSGKNPCTRNSAARDSSTCAGAVAGLNSIRTSDASCSRVRPNSAPGTAASMLVNSILGVCAGCAVVCQSSTLAMLLTSSTSPARGTSPRSWRESGRKENGTKSATTESS
nr:GGDEF domain-containing protein [Cryobacterium psychrophilum]